MAVTLTHHRIGHVRRLVYDIVAAADGSVPATPLPACLEGTLLALQTEPLSPAPSDQFSVWLLQDGYDLLEGAGQARSSSVVQKAVIRYAGKDVHPVFDESDTLTLAIRDNSVAFAVFRVSITYGLGAAR